MGLLYNIGIILYFVITLPYYLYKMAFARKYRAGLFQRLGFISRPAREELSGRRVIWIHAVSVGEVQAAMPLIKELRAKLPDRSVLLSTTTMTGNAIAVEKAGGMATVIYFPLDFPWAVRRALRAFKPEVVAIVETEIWPNFLKAARRQGVPVVIVNGRISDRSFGGYLKLRPILRGILECIDVFCMQTGADAGRVERMGAPRDRIRVTGNMKYEASLGTSPGKEQVCGEIGLDAGRGYIVAGSTHSGEEEILIRVYERLRGRFKGLSLIVVPRHPERSREVLNIARAAGISSCLRSELPSRPETPDVVVVDTIGELMSLYAVAEVVFVGKSLAGHGGQNVIEPASLGKAVLFGPHMENFKQASGLLLEAGGAAMVQGEEELEKRLGELLSDDGARTAMGERARRVVECNRGATAGNVALIEEMLKK